MTDKIEDLNIRDESAGGVKVYRLYFGNMPRGAVSQGLNGQVKFHWNVSGPCNLEESQVWVRGLVELLAIGEQLNLEGVAHGPEKKKKSLRRRRRSRGQGLS